MSCPFCRIDESRIAFSNDLIVAVWDGFPVSPGHLLIAPRRHTSRWLDLSSPEKAATWSAVGQGQSAISERFHPEGFKVGFNEGSAAGQTDSHFHLHIIPRYEGDVVDPRGGIRQVIPSKANDPRHGESLPRPAIDQKLVTGGDEPLLPHLLLHLDDEAYEVSIEKNAINIVRKPDEDVNLLPNILRLWFGNDAGLPGRGERVRLKRSPSGFEMEALRIQSPQGLQVWSRYLREAIAPAFGLAFSQAIWNAGFVVQDPEVFLLVTLAKGDMNTEHRYVDHFVSDREFAWQSQNRTTKASKHGQILSNHRAQGKRVHLFVRPTKKTGSKPTLFIYCGEVDFVSWEGDAPISIKWRLREAVPPPLLGVLSVPT